MTQLERSGGGGVRKVKERNCIRNLFLFVSAALSAGGKGGRREKFCGRKQMRVAFCFIHPQFPSTPHHEQTAEVRRKMTLKCRDRKIMKAKHI